MMWILFLATFWVRECELNQPCKNLPAAIVPSLKFSGEIAEPQSLGQSTQKNFEIKQGDLFAQATFFWAKPKQGEPRVVTQVTLFHKGVRLAQCSWYQKPELAFPVTPGACSGFLQSENSIQKQFGVSFSRTQEPSQ